MRIKIRYLSHEIANCFQSITKYEYLTFQDTEKYKDLLEVLEKKVCKPDSKSVFKNFVIISNGHRISEIKNKPLDTKYEVIVAHADTGG